MNITWINPVELVEYELRQLEEEGKDISTLRIHWEAARAENRSAGALRRSSQRFLEELYPPSKFLEDSPTEPSTLEEILALCPPEPGDTAPPMTESFLTDRIKGGWLGRAAGCLLGKPVERTPREGIKLLLTSNGTWPLMYYITEEGIPHQLLIRYPWNIHSGRQSLRENIVCMPEDDDMNYPMVNLSVLERSGRKFTTEDVAKAWLEMLPILSTFTAERVAYLNCLRGLTPPETAFSCNPYREWIGAQIRGDVFGWVSPACPRRAAKLAHTDARLSHVRNGIYGEMFVAAMIASAFTVASAREVIETALACIPPESRLAEAVRFALTLPTSEPAWEGAVDRLYDRYGQYHWVHAVNNASLVAAALLFGEGDFERSVCNVVMGGWDTDSNGATVGSVVGTMLGARALPERWIMPLNNRIRSSLKGFDNSAFDRLAARTAALAST